MEVSGDPATPSSDICSICHSCLSASPPDAPWWWSLVYGKSRKLSVCKHEFHGGCWKNWQRASKLSTCPLCRAFEKDVTVANEGRSMISSSIGNARCMECRCIFTREEGIPEGSLKYFHCQDCARKISQEEGVHCRVS
eukprot:8133_1